MLPHKKLTKRQILAGKAITKLEYNKTTNGEDDDATDF
jgi:hypothetical protein